MPDDVTPLIARLVGARWPGTELASVVHLAGDFSTRRYLRAGLAGGGAPETAIVMVLAGSGLPLSSEELGVFDAPPVELPFLDVHRLLTAIGVPVPDVYVAAVDQGVLILEDAGDVALWDAAARDPAGTERLYRRAIDVLLVLHERGTTHRPATSIAFQQGLDARLLQWELEHFLEWGVERRLGLTLSAAARRGYQESFDAITRELAWAPRVLSHRDYHGWNLLWRGDRPIVIDFQDAFLAPPEYDLASLLTDRVTPRLIDAPMEQRLLAHYWSGRGRTEDLDRRRYARIALHRALKVLGRIHYIALAKGKPAPLAFLSDVVATCRRFLAEVPLPGALPSEFAAQWPAAAP
ncbi:MAG: phosphotransferase [Myxococcales bacterium]|jgi:aminoglycoside/choline kinase family phosphotransferase|nr:phosphotransferase [Myxococcales bacterium]